MDGGVQSSWSSGQLQEAIHWPKDPLSSTLVANDGIAGRRRSKLCHTTIVQRQRSDEHRWVHQYLEYMI